jgi:hypothetical protein
LTKNLKELLIGLISEWNLIGNCAYCPPTAKADHSLIEEAVAVSRKVLIIMGLKPQERF